MLRPAQKFRSQPLDRIRTTNERLMQRKEEEKECAKGTKAIRLAADNTSRWQQLLLFSFALSHSITIVPSCALCMQSDNLYGAKWRRSR